MYVNFCTPSMLHPWHAESFDVKNSGMYKLYDKQRLIMDKASEQYIVLENKMFEISDSMEIPKGIDVIKNARW